MNGHHYDGVGICIYCNLCDDPDCCEGANEPCSKSISRQLAKSMETAIRERFGK